MWDFAGGSPRSHISAAVASSLGPRWVPPKCSSADELLAVTFRGNAQCLCAALLVFADPLHRQEEGQAAFSLFLAPVSIIG